MVRPVELIGSDPPPLRSSMPEVTDRIQEIIEAAERAAAQIIADAESQARVYLDETRIRADRSARERAEAVSEIAEDLARQIDSVSRQAKELIASLQKASEGAPPLPTPLRPATDDAARPAGEEPPSTAKRREFMVAPTQEDEVWASGPEPPAPGPEPAVPPQQASEGARLLATQMAISGSDRRTIERRLITEFGIDNPQEIIDIVLGSDS